MKKYFILIILILNSKLYAEIITDGTIGQRNHLIGPNFVINEQLGLQVGNNLFHSFQTFNIKTGQTATFSSSSSVTNILARVTGNESSWIDGKISSDANLYLLNPNGIVFGENASLSINGSFHASTADYLRLGKTGKFSASQPQESLLTVAAPEAFGFLTAPSSITIEGSAMMVPPKQTISIIGGDLFIKDSFLFAESGRINLASVASSGEIILKPSDLIVDSFEKFGQIHLSESRPIPNEERFIANLDVSDIFSQETGAGQIFIRAGKFISNNAWIFADSYGNEDGLGIDILIEDNLNLTNDSRITTDNGGIGQGGNIKIQVKDLTLNSFSAISSNTYGAGEGGKIIINASNIEMQQGLIQTATEESGKAGKIDLTLNTLKLDQSIISSGTKGDGKAGNIIINANENISLFNGGFISALSSGSADAGSINITTNTASFSNSSGITTQSSKTNAGNITFSVTDHLDLSDNSAIVAKAKGNAGNITITTKTASFSNNSGITTQSFNTSGGNIEFTVTDRLYLSDNSRITAEAHGDGGNINISGKPEFVILNNSQLRANAYEGNGGNIRIFAENFIGSGNSIITASSDKAIDGQIEINAHEYELKNNFSVLPRNFLTSTVEYTKKVCGSKNPDVASLAILGHQILPESPYSLGVHIPEELFTTSTNLTEISEALNISYNPCAITDVKAI
jgi:filamentous hemagglutinin family protein